MRNLPFLPFGLSFAIVASVAVGGCSATTPGDTFGNVGGNGSGGASGTAGSMAQGGSTNTGGSTGEGGSFIPPMDDGGVPPQMPGEVFGHSSSTLFKLEPYTKAVTTIGQFQSCSGVIDLAIDKDSKIIATTFDGLYWIDKTNAQCTKIADGSYPNSLSFVPAGTLDPNVEALVGYQGSSYVRIDTTTGQVNQIGAIGNGFSSSGDIVSVKGGGTYLTVNGNGCGDCLIQVDPKTGAMIKNWGPLGFGSVFGIAFWAGSVYGFTNGGELFEVTFANNQMNVAKINIPNAPANLSFWGAGSTTIAPPIAPPK